MVEEPVLTDSFEKVSRLRPDLSPLLNLSNIIVHAFASGQSRRKHGGKSAKVFKTVDDVLSFKVSHNSFNLL